VKEMTILDGRQAIVADQAALHRALYSFVSSRLKDRTDGEDIVQETYVRLYDYQRTRTITDAAAFCFAVARNLINDHFRRLRTLPLAEEAAEDVACSQPLVEEVLDFRQRVDILVSALKVMPALRREIFMRRRLDGVPGPTIASDLGMSLAAVEKHCTRALADLRYALERRGLALGDHA
jgi:RNA polymerase sigma factor (sigma-70 family)